MNFEERVLALVKEIPKGKVMTYKDLAHALDSRAYRAVGQALRKNPHPITVPCHRVVCSDGRLGGYGGKMHSKKKISLLRKEGVAVEQGRVNVERFGWSKK